MWITAILLDASNYFCSRKNWYGIHVIMVYIFLVETKVHTWFHVACAELIGHLPIYGEYW